MNASDAVPARRSAGRAAACRTAATPRAGSARERYANGHPEGAPFEQPRGAAAPGAARCGRRVRGQALSVERPAPMTWRRPRPRPSLRSRRLRRTVTSKFAPAFTTPGRFHAGARPPKLSRTRSTPARLASIRNQVVASRSRLADTRWPPSARRSSNDASCHSPRRRREDPNDFRVAHARRRAPALQQHLVHGVHRQEVALERERPVGEAREAGPRLIAVRVEPVAQDERFHEDVEQAQRLLGLADPRAQGRHPAEAVAAPRLVPFRPTPRARRVIMRASPAPPSSRDRLNGCRPMRLDRCRWLSGRSASAESRRVPSARTW